MGYLCNCFGGYWCESAILCSGSVSLVFLGIPIKGIATALQFDKSWQISTILPVLALAMFPMASVERYTRSEMISIMNSDYMLLAASKGVPKAKLVLRHALRNTLISVITVLVPLLVSLMSGSLVMEKIFSIPGLGSLYIQAIQQNDYNVVLTISFIYSLMFIIAMLLVDIAYGLIDPRIRLAGGKD